MPISLRRNILSIVPCHKINHSSNRERYIKNSLCIHQPKDITYKIFIPCI
uniref:Uncharacterized protein n=1 Tax=Arundo donax TaxID=35708 RepID=A0A0A9AYT0_ARUDO